MNAFFDPEDEFDDEDDFTVDNGDDGDGLDDGPRCAGCGCSESNACEGGCVWATPTLCSRCA